MGAGTADLAFTTENSHDVEQQVLPTYAVIASPAWGAVGEVGSFDFSRLLHGSQQIRLFAPLKPAGRLSVVSEVADIQDKGEGENAIRELAGFPRPILHGLCTYGVAGRALVAAIGDGDATRITAIGARFTSPVFPGETLTTSVWRTAEEERCSGLRPPPRTAAAPDWCSRTGPRSIDLDL